MLNGVDDVSVSVSLNGVDDVSVGNFARDDPKTNRKTKTENSKDYTKALRSQKIRGRKDPSYPRIFLDSTQNIILKELTAYNFHFH